MTSRARTLAAASRFGAHIGGFIAGLLLAPVFMFVTGRRRERLPDGERGLIR